MLHHIGQRMSHEVHQVVAPLIGFRRIIDRMKISQHISSSIY
jgi:hypothetical protein